MRKHSSAAGMLCVSEAACVVSGVLVLSWYPPGMADDNGEPSDDLVPAILDTAHQYNIQVSLQEEIECPLAHSGDFPSSAHRDSASTQVLGMSPAMAKK